MKKSLLLTAAALTTMAMSAQTDVTPKNWKFSDMEAGTSAYENKIFWEEWASTDWGIRTAGEFVNAVGNDGGIIYASGTSLTGGTVTNNYDNMTEGDKAALKNIYESATIIDAGRNGNETENILCFISSSASTSFTGGNAATTTMQDGTFFWYSGKDLSYGNYRMTFEYRAIIGNSVASGIDLTFLGADYYTVNTYKYDVQAGLKDRWCKVTVDFALPNPGDATNTFPLIIKWYFHSLLQEGVMLFRSPKLELLPGDMEYSNGSFTASDFSDSSLSEPTSIEEINFENDVIVTTANGNITVIDANAPVEVYNIAGAKVASVAAPAAVETIDLDMDGVFVVKVGDKVQKVIL